MDYWNCSHHNSFARLGNFAKIFFFFFCKFRDVLLALYLWRFVITEKAIETFKCKSTAI